MKFEKLPGDRISSGNIFVRVETAEEILVNKLISLFQRKRLQYRDFYDIGFLSGICHNVINEAYLFKKIERLFPYSVFAEKLASRVGIFDDMEAFATDFRKELERFIPRYRVVEALSDEMIEYVKNQVEEGVRLCYEYVNAGGKMRKSVS